MREANDRRARRPPRLLAALRSHPRRALARRPARRQRAQAAAALVVAAGAVAARGDRHFPRLRRRVHRHRYPHPDLRGWRRRGDERRLRRLVRLQQQPVRVRVGGHGEIGGARVHVLPPHQLLPEPPPIRAPLPHTRAKAPPWPAAARTGALRLSKAAGSGREAGGPLPAPAPHHDSLSAACARCATAMTPS